MSSSLSVCLIGLSAWLLVGVAGVLAAREFPRPDEENTERGRIRSVLVCL